MTTQHTATVVTCMDCGSRKHSERTAQTAGGTKFFVWECRECGNEAKAPTFTPDVVDSMDGFRELTVEGQERLQANMES